MSRQQATNRELGIDTARANLLTNGGFEIWQRGNGPFVGSGAPSADRWTTYKDGTDAMSVSRNTANSVNAVGACAAVTFTKGSGTGSQIFQVFKPSDGAWISGATVTFSIMVKATVANAVRIGVYQDPAGTYTYSSFHTGGGAYERLSLTITLPANLTEADIGPMFSASGTFYLDNAMLVVGAVPADYAPLHPMEDRARCERYYEAIQPPQSMAFTVMQVYHAAVAFGALAFRVPKVVSPTVTFDGPSAFSLRKADASIVPCIAVSVHGANELSMQVEGNVGTPVFTPGNASVFHASTGVSARFWIEANP